jgi:integrase/recombinase XerC
MPHTPVPGADRIITRFARKRRNDWSEENIANATRVLNRVHAHLLEAGLTGLLHADVDELADAIDDHLHERLQTRAASSVLVDHRQLAAFYKWATVDQGDGERLIRRNPMRDVAAPKVGDPDPQPVAQLWQYEAILATCRQRRTRNGTKPINDRRDAAVIALLWHTGMRRSEICNLDYERLDFDAERVHLPRTKGGRRKPKSRWVAIPEEAMELLDLYIDGRGTHDGPLFTSTRGGRLHPNSLGQMLERRGVLAAVALGLDEAVHMPSHSCRRASAIDWLDNGGSETGLMRNHGWSTRKMIDVYTAPSKDELTAAEARRVAAARRARSLRIVS